MSGLRNTAPVTLSKFPQQGNPPDHCLLGEYSEYAGLSAFTIRMWTKSFRCSASPYFNAVTALAFKVSPLNVLGNRHDVENHAQLSCKGKFLARCLPWIRNGAPQNRKANLPLLRLSSLFRRIVASSCAADIS